MRLPSSEKDSRERERRSVLGRETQKLQREEQQQRQRKKKKKKKKKKKRALQGTERVDER